FAGGLLGSSFLLSTEAFIAKTDAMLAGLVTLALAALARIYFARRGGPPAGLPVRLAFWLGLSGALLVKGPVGLAVVALTMIMLALWERRVDWLRDLGLGWGPILLVAIVGPWAAAVTVATDGAFWSTAIMGDLAPKLAGGHETHGAPPGYHLVLLPLLAFPMTLLIPAGLIHGWTARAEPGVRFALCWLIPTWIMFELAPTKLVHYTLPAFGALAWLSAAALQTGFKAPARWIGGALLLPGFGLWRGGGRDGCGPGGGTSGRGGPGGRFHADQPRAQGCDGRRRGPGHSRSRRPGRRPGAGALAAVAVPAGGQHPELRTAAAPPGGAGPGDGHRLCRTLPGVRLGHHHGVGRPGA
ncbi:MAG TPA: hypothetical protein PKA17_12365, partial [Phenylobacterium sp.]|nr:hypothetical protein [Phenylobacterium sp.]